MAILVSGLINYETTLRVDDFPVEYAPVRYPFFGVNSSISGVGYNVARALARLGHEVELLALIGRDPSRLLVRDALAQSGVRDTGVIEPLEVTPQTVILYDGSGRRAIYTDLKDIQDQVYPPDLATAALDRCSLAVLCNINFSRPLLARARRAGKLIATDVHVIQRLDDDYNRDFMAAADILFMSHERLTTRPEDWVRRVQERFGTAILVIGLGAEGALLAVRETGTVERFPAVYTRPVVSTVGAGDALFAAFVHTYQATHDPQLALRKALVFASYKIGTVGGADGFLSAAELDAWDDAERS